MSGLGSSSPPARIYRPRIHLSRIQGFPGFGIVRLRGAADCSAGGNQKTDERLSSLSPIGARVNEARPAQHRRRVSFCFSHAPETWTPPRPRWDVPAAAARTAVAGACVRRDPTGSAREILLLGHRSREAPRHVLPAHAARGVVQLCTLLDSTQMCLCTARAPTLDPER